VLDAFTQIFKEIVLKSLMGFVMVVLPIHVILVESIGGSLLSTFILFLCKIRGLLSPLLSWICGMSLIQNGYA
jgi:hypothetical protein